MKAFKGFNRDLTCRGFQYKEGETFETDGAELCNSGFHACEHPLDCFTYYRPNHSVYHEVELGGVTDETDDDTKRCGTRIKIGARLSIVDLCHITFEYVKEHCKGKNSASTGQSVAAGFLEAATAGIYGAASAGDHGAAEAGDNGAATAGCYGAAKAGECGAATAGAYAAAMAGERGAATAGYYGAAVAGARGAATAGNNGAATAGAHGAATAGECGAATAGEYGAATSRGSAEVGARGIACAKGYRPRVKGGFDAVLILAKENFIGRVTECAVAVVDGKKIKANVWYTLEDGQFKECKE